MWVFIKKVCVMKISSRPSWIHWIVSWIIYVCKQCDHMPIASHPTQRHTPPAARVATTQLDEPRARERTHEVET